MFGFNSTIRVVCMICRNTFLVNEGMFNPNDNGL